MVEDWHGGPQDALAYDGSFPVPAKNLVPIDFLALPGFSLLISGCMNNVLLSLLSTRCLSSKSRAALQAEILAVI